MLERLGSILFVLVVLSNGPRVFAATLASFRITPAVVRVSLFAENGDRTLPRPTLPAEVIRYGDVSIVRAYLPDGMATLLLHPAFADGRHEVIVRDNAIVPSRHSIRARSGEVVIAEAAPSESVHTVTLIHAEIGSQWEPGGLDAVPACKTGLTDAAETSPVRSGTE